MTPAREWNVSRIRSLADPNARLEAQSITDHITADVERGVSLGTSAQATGSRITMRTGREIKFRRRRALSEMRDNRAGRALFWFSPGLLGRGHMVET